MLRRGDPAPAGRNPGVLAHAVANTSSAPQESFRLDEESEPTCNEAWDDAVRDNEAPVASLWACHSSAVTRLAGRLRAVLAERPLEIAEMVAALEVDERAVLVGRRDLGEKKPSRLRSGVGAGRNCWWWEPEDAASAAGPAAGDQAAPGAST